MYKKTDKISDLISNHYKILLVITRFGISLGFGDKTIEEVCNENKVDITTFMLIVNILIDDYNHRDFEIKKVSPITIVNYLENSHNYFLNFRLPDIREKLQHIVNKDKTDLSNPIMFYFDEYISEVIKHMKYEEKFVFPYVKELVKKNRQDSYNIAIFVSQHNHIEDRISEFKNIILKYYSSTSVNELNSVLFDIFSCEEDLAAHIFIEDKLLVPIVRKLENQIK